MITLPDSVKQRTALLEQRCRVIEVGPQAWLDEAEPRAKAGDLVLVSKMAGYMAVGTADGKDYRLVNANDIFCGIVAEAEVANG